MLIARSIQHRPGQLALRPSVRHAKGNPVSCAIKVCVIIIFLAVLILAGQLLASWTGLLEFDDRTEIAMQFALLVFILAAATPFVPGAEIGLALLMVFGKDAALEVYLSMVAALLLAFTIGRLVPAKFVAKLQTRAECRWRLFRLRSSRVRRWGSPVIIKRVRDVMTANRHVTLGAVLNMPGNSVLGGGGGIALMAGASRQYSYLGFGATTSIAVLPIPLMVCLFG